MLECWLHPSGFLRGLITRPLGQEHEHSQNVVDCDQDAIVEEGGDDRSEGGFGLGAFRFNLLLSYSGQALWACLGITLAAQRGRDLCLVRTDRIFWEMPAGPGDDFQESVTC